MKHFETCACGHPSNQHRVIASPPKRPCGANRCLCSDFKGAVVVTVADLEWRLQLAQDRDQAHIDALLSDAAARVMAWAEEVFEEYRYLRVRMALRSERLDELCERRLEQAS